MRNCEKETSRALCASNIPWHTRARGRFSLFFTWRGMNVLEDWLESHSSSLHCAPGVQDHVEFDGENSRASTVSLNCKASYGVRLATLLHECGHIIIFFRRRRNKTKRIFGCSHHEWWSRKGRCRRRTKSLKLSTLEEEIGAWELGERLGKRLGVRFSRKTLERVRTRALLTYTRDCH